MPSTHSVVLVALLPIPMKNRDIPLKRLDEQRWTNWEVLNKVLRRFLQPLTFKYNHGADSGYYNVLCADGNLWHRRPVLAARLADCPEYSDLHHLEWHISFWCECPKNELGDYVLPDMQHTWRDHNIDRTLSVTDTMAANAKLSLRHVHRGFNVFRHIPWIVSDLTKPDLLYTVHIGILYHLQMWIFQFIKMHEWLKKYNAIWLFVPAYHDLTPTKKSSEKVSQWNG